MRLEMLWERIDPSTALRERFDVATPEAAHDWITDVLIEEYGRPPVELDGITISAHNLMVRATTDLGPALVKVCRLADAHEHLSARAELVAWLGERGHPVAVPWRSLRGEHQIVRDDRSVGVHPWLDGSLLDGADLTQVRAAGSALAGLHLDLAQWPEQARLRSAPGSAGRGALWAFPPGRRDALPADLLERLDWLRADLPLLPDQPVHGDFRGANVLTRGERVTAILDFEEARLAPAVVDLANTVCLLGTWYHDWQALSPQSEAALVDGYRAVRPLSEAEQRWLTPLVGWQLLAMGWTQPARRWLTRR